MRRVFFSFKYDDVWEANVIRNSWAFASAQDREAFGFVDKAEREQLKRQGDAAIVRWIRAQMTGTSVTVVLMGAHTCESRWVKFEIEESIREGKGLLGIRTHEILDRTQEKRMSFSFFEPPHKPEPTNMFGYFRVTDTADSSSFWKGPVPTEISWRPPRDFFDRMSQRLSDFYCTYNWKGDNGRENIAKWIESAAAKAGR